MTNCPKGTKMKNGRCTRKKSKIFKTRKSLIGTISIIALISIGILFMVFFLEPLRTFLTTFPDPVQNIGNINLDSSNFDGNDLTLSLSSIDSSNWDVYTFYKWDYLDVLVSADIKKCFELNGLWFPDKSSCRFDSLGSFRIRSSEGNLVTSGMDYPLDVSIGSRSITAMNIPSVTDSGKVNVDLVLSVVCKESEEFCINNKISVCKKEPYSTTLFGQLLEGEKNSLVSTDESCGIIPPDPGTEEKITVFRLEGNECSTIEILPSEKTEIDFDTLEDCEENKSSNFLNILYIILGV